MASQPFVVKLGSSLIVGEDGAPRRELLGKVAADIAGYVRGGGRVAVVSSGAIALGRVRAGLDARRRPTLAHLQAASALGQAELQQLWQQAFAPHSLDVAQVLLTAVDLTERRSYLNIRDALKALFQAGAVPVLNENDATATDEISFGDNDVLAAQVAVLVRARRLALLTNVEGVLASSPGDGSAEVINDGADVDRAAFGPGSKLGRGGIGSKVAAARLAAAGGVETFVTAPSSLAALLAGDEAGTRFAPHPESEPAFKLWLRYGKQISSHVRIDDGAVHALQHGGASLLAVGVLDWSDEFKAGDGLLICDSESRPVARGIAALDATAVADRAKDVEVVNRDRLVLTDQLD